MSRNKCAKTVHETPTTHTTTSSSPRWVTPPFIQQKEQQEKDEPTTLPPQTKTPSNNWLTIYELVQELRKDRNAPCDHSGAQALADSTRPAPEFCFHVLTALLLSSQTKDAVVGQDIRNMQQDNVLNVTVIARFQKKPCIRTFKRLVFTMTRQST